MILIASWFWYWSSWTLVRFRSHVTRYSRNIKIARWNIQYAFCCSGSCVFYNCIKRVETVPFLTAILPEMTYCHTCSNLLHFYANKPRYTFQLELELEIPDIRERKLYFVRNNWSSVVCTQISNVHIHPYPYIRLKSSWHIATWLQKIKQMIKLKHEMVQLLNECLLVKQRWLVFQCGRPD